MWNECPYWASTLQSYGRSVLVECMYCCNFACCTELSTFQVSTSIHVGLPGYLLSCCFLVWLHYCVRPPVSRGHCFPVRRHYCSILPSLFHFVELALVFTETELDKRGWVNVILSLRLKHSMFVYYRMNPCIRCSVCLNIIWLVSFHAVYYTKPTFVCLQCFFFPLLR